MTNGSTPCRVALPGQDARRSPINNNFITRHFPASIIAAVLLTAFAASGPQAFAGDDRDHDHDSRAHWVSIWQGSPTQGGTFFSPGCPSDVGLNNQTVRNIVFTSAGGSWVRARISNFGGATPLRVGSATMAISAGGAAVVPGSLRTLHFSGKDSILIAQGGEVVSDPVHLHVQPQQNVVVSIYLPQATGLATEHYIAEQTNYLASGDETAVPGGTVFGQQISCWMFLSGVEAVTSPRVFGALVTLGDSITDGYLSTANTNRRFPDDLARKLAARNGPTLSVSNAADTGNELLITRNFLQFGLALPARLGRDVLNQPGAKAVILLEGINDIGDKSVKAEDLIPIYEQTILACHEAGLKIYGGTLTPFGGSNAIYGGDYGTDAGEAERQKVNHWIRASHAFDGVIDFDKAVRDPANPKNMLLAYQGDPLHPNDAGYQAMANAVNLDAIIADILFDH